MADWQPIETAPKDGTRVTLKRVYKNAVVAEGEGFFGSVTINYAEADGGPETYHARWVAGDGKHFFPEPTHWQPLLDPPVLSPPGVDA